MSAAPDTVVQANFKTPKGTLINVYGKDEAAFDYALAIIQDRIAVIAEIEQQLSGSSAVADTFALAPVQPAAAAGVAPVAEAPIAASTWGAPAAAPVAAPPAAFAAAAAKNCAHGPMTARSGVSARGPWKAYMCPTPKGTPDQCKAQFIDSKSPEFASFPG